MRHIFIINKYNEWQTLVISLWVLDRCLTLSHPHVNRVLEKNIFGLINWTRMVFSVLGVTAKKKKNQKSGS